MHIIECHFEFSGYDDQLVKAGTSVYLWNLVRQFRDKGHQVTAVTAAHGLLPRLRRDHEVEELDWTLDEELPVPEDWSILVEKAQALPSPPPPQRRTQHQAQQQ